MALQINRKDGFIFVRYKINNFLFLTACENFSEISVLIYFDFYEFDLPMASRYEINNFLYLTFSEIFVNVVEFQKC